MKYLLGIDFGGGSAKAALLSEEGKIAAEASAEYPTYHPENGFCEQDPEDWKVALGEVVYALLNQSRISSSDIIAIALDSATHTAVLCDESFRPLRDAIHWTDSRSAEQSERLRSQYGDRIFELTYHKPDTIWTLPQLIWVRENEAEIFEKIRFIFFEKDYLRFLLTGTFCTDEIEAQGSMLYDANSRMWSDELCRMAGISPGILPPIVRPTDIIGKVTETGAEFTGLCVGTPVICGTTDTAMEVFASGAVKKGDTTVKLATAGRICVITDRACPDRDIVNYPHIVNGLWYPGTATKAAASSFRWFRDTFGGNYRELDNHAAEISAGCDGLMFHPYINGELTPYADPSLCGSFTGIRSTHSKAHFTRSVLEGVALSLLHSKMKLEELGIPVSARATLIGGGSKSSLWSQIVADCLNMELYITDNSDSSLGSAMLAGIAVGVFNSPEEAVKKCIHVNRCVRPCGGKYALYAELFERYVRIHDALAPIYRENKK